MKISTPDFEGESTPYEESKYSSKYSSIAPRTIQMKSAQLQMTTIFIEDEMARFEAKGKVIQFPGFLKVYVEDIDDPNQDKDDKESVLPPLEKGAKIAANKFIPKQHFTKPSPRYTEASLVKKLEKLENGNTSSYSTKYCKFVKIAHNKLATIF